MAGRRRGLVRLGRGRVQGRDPDRHLIRRDQGLAPDPGLDRTRPGRPQGPGRDQALGRILPGRLRHRPAGGVAGGMWIRLPPP